MRNRIRAVSSAENGGYLIGDYLLKKAILADARSMIARDGHSYESFDLDRFCDYLNESFEELIGNIQGIFDSNSLFTKHEIDAEEFMQVEEVYIQSYKSDIERMIIQSCARPDAAPDVLTPNLGLSIWQPVPERQDDAPENGGGLSSVDAHAIVAESELDEDDAFRLS